MASIRKRTWTSGAEVKTAFVADYFDQEGKRRLRTFKKERDAKAWLAETVIEVKKGVHTPANKSITIAEAGEEWIDQATTDGLEAATIRQYRQHLDYHITPLIGGIKLAEFAPAAVTSFRNRLIATQRSRSMAKKVVVSLGAILGTAMANGRVARNVVREQSRQHGQRQRRIEKRHDKHLEVGVDIPTKEEIRAILGAAQGRWRPLIVTAIFTGLRASELRGLRWSDLDLTNSVLTVRQRADRYNTIGSPKSDSGKREVPLSSMVVHALKEWRLACPKGDLGLVFPNGEGNVESLPNIHRRGLGSAQVKAGIVADSLHPKYGLHAFRHAAASLFIEEGFSPKQVQTLMGHSTIQVTFDTYGHLFPSSEGDKAKMERLQARIINGGA
jgi:integrase